MAEQAVIARQHARTPVLLIILIWGILYVLAPVVGGWLPPAGTLLDTDSYMRLLEIEALLSHGNWFDHHVAAVNAPFGTEIHWSRALDILILALVFPFMMFMDSGTALYLAGYWISPLLVLASALFFARMGDAVIGPRRWLLPIVIFLISDAVFSYGSLGRADYHILLLIAFMTALCLTAEFLRKPLSRRAASRAGFALAFGLWCASEMMLVVTPMIAALMLAWAFRRGPDASALQWTAFVFLAGLAGFVAIEYTPSNWLTLAYDKISFAHICLAGLWLAACVGLRGLEKADRLQSVRHRLIALAAIGAGAFGIVAVFFPGFLAEPLSWTAPEARNIWLQHVQELRSSLPVSVKGLQDFMLFVGPGIVLFPLGLVAFSRASVDQRLIWTPLLLATIIVLPLTLLHVRAGLYLALIFATLIGALMPAVDNWAKSRFGTPVAALILIGFVLISAVGGKSVAAALQIGRSSATNVEVARQKSDTQSPAAMMDCGINELAPLLNAALPPGTIVLSDVDLGPALAYHSHVRVIAVPYHRMGDGVLAAHEMLATADLSLARMLMRSRDVGAILICDRPASRLFFGSSEADTLYRQVTTGQVPDWLQTVTLPGPFSGMIRLYRVLD